jgi:hypothetical protein
MSLGTFAFSLQAAARSSGPSGLALARIAGEEIAALAIVFGVGGALLFPIVRALALRLESGRRPSPGASAEVGERLERIERAVEAVALEVERISEGQRFVTKLLAERSEQGRLPPVTH